MNKYKYELEKFNNKNIEIKINSSFDFIECESEEEARLLLSFANRILQNPKYKKVEFSRLININEYKIMKGYLLEDTPFVLYKNSNNNSWYMYHYPTGIGLSGLFGASKREDTTHNLKNMYKFYKRYNKNKYYIINTEIEVKEDFLNL